ncbi:MAG: SDR family oxidoreductase [Saprospiraceae bacterium]|jgi:dehydrogenase/reductase SDR family protein 7B|nr:SDR family oxidoreductase [Saprospiraceae bacterium]MDG2419794.1 SDR family oxidoreductase [Saprospiraceae bacterium]
MKYTNQVVWITGASSGIGEALAIEFAKEKSKIVLSARRAEVLKAVAGKCEELGVECLVLPMDVTNYDVIEENVDIVLNKFGKIDVLINNAGISQRGLTVETNFEVDRRIMEINYFGNIALTKAVLPKMIEQKNGQIVTMSSLVGIFGFPQRSSYSASKHALHGFYETLMVEHYNDNLKINIICPGRIKTDISINSLTKDGTQHGKMDPGQAKGISAEKCAQIIVKSMKRNKRVTVIGMEGKLMVFFKKFMPRLFYKIASNISAT